MLAGGAWALLQPGRMSLSPPELAGGPLRIRDAETDRVFLITTQWTSWSEHRQATIRGSRSRHVTDLWIYDTAGRVAPRRLRLATADRAFQGSPSLLGAEASTIWILLPSGLVGISAREGQVTADTARLEAHNPQLRGILGVGAQSYRFDDHGLRLTTMDGREWRIDPGSLAAHPVNADNTRSPPHVTRPAWMAPGPGWLQGRGVSVGDRWFGLLNEQDAHQFRTRGPLGDMDHTRAGRHRLWAARREHLAASERRRDEDPVWTLLTRARYVDFTPLPESPEFQEAGLLRTVGEPSQMPLLLRNPDSVLVLHRDVLGHRQRLRLTRLSGPTGRAEWETALPISMVNAVMPAPEASPVTLDASTEMVLFGTETFAQTTDNARSGQRYWLVSLRPSTGHWRARDVTDDAMRIRAEQISGQSN
ncbi:PA2928 family protein [Muricoccus radiodurans]|uniref:PA2928 family protein n=1 Tax=Muricoccus radiodurans TaxID=2231721 RepID=UPI003CF707FC